MVALNAVGRLRQQHDLRAYRRALTASLGQDFALRQLPGLIDLPLRILDIDGDPQPLLDAPNAAWMTLAGAPGSGRRLALQQIAARWAAGGASGPTPALISLARLDDGHATPAALLGAWLQSTNQGAWSRASERSLGAADRLANWRLLIHGWEDLPSQRREVWRAALLDAPRRWPLTSAIVALPESEPSWPDFAARVIAPPTPELLTDWIQRLAPPERRAAALDALLADGAPQPLAERLFEVALMAWLVARAPLPATRADLYAHTLAAALGVPPSRLTLATPVVELQLLAAYGERPSEIITGLIEPGANGVPRFLHPQIRRYLAARQLADERRYTPLQIVERTERAELALLLATMSDDPLPLYAALWGAGRLHADDIFTLARCLRERPPRGHAWPLRVIGALALLARDGSQPQRERAGSLLRDILPVLDARLDAAAQSGEATQRFLERLFTLLPPDLATPRMERLAYAAETPEPLAWDLTDMLVARANRADADPPDAPDDPAALARWSYVQALHSPPRRRLLEAGAHATPAALADPSVDLTRRLRAAQALLADPALSTRTRLAALALVEAIDHPAAFDTIERAVGDASTDIQRGALTALAERDGGRVYAALRQAALDPANSWEARLDAIDRLSDYLLEGAAELLDQSARDHDLPLFMRMRAVAALGRQAAGLPQLVALALDASCPPELRAGAVRRIGAAGHRAASDDLLGLLTDPTIAPQLAEAICDALGALGDPAARPVIARTLDRADDDVTLTLAAMRALGALGGSEAVAPLSRLLGSEADARLRNSVPERLLALAPERCLSEPDLPPDVALRLSTVLAAGMTPADRPTTLAEFFMHEADRLRAGAARALAAIGGDSAQAALLAALLDGATGGAAADLIAAQAALEGPDSAESLAYLLIAEEVQPLTRWLVVQHLTTHPSGAAVMQRMLARADVDSFTRGALAEALGQCGATDALPLLRALAEDAGCDEHLRMQAVLALGLLDHPLGETTLVHLIGDASEQTLLRGLAAENLPAMLSDEGRRFLRDLLRRERPAGPIVAGALRALGRARDREALPQMLRYATDGSASVAQAAISALTEIGDASVTPVLVQITQEPSADRAVRLQAIGALLRLGGESYRPLLHEYIDQGALPLQFQALDHLIAAGEPPTDALATFAARGRPLPLRLWLIESMQEDSRAAPFLLDIVQDDADDPDIRGLAAQALGRAGYAPAAPAFIRYAEDSGAPAGVRLHCIDALGALGGVESWLALGRLVEDPGQPPSLHTWAFQALRRLAPAES